MSRDILTCECGGRLVGERRRVGPIDIRRIRQCDRCRCRVTFIERPAADIRASLDDSMLSAASRRFRSWRDATQWVHGNETSDSTD